MADTKDDAVEEMIRDAESKYDYITFTICDFHGIPRGITVSRKHFRKFFYEGPSVYSGTLGMTLAGQMNLPPNILKANLGNVCCKPIPGTLGPLPTRKTTRATTGGVMCNPHYAMNGKIQEEYPRWILQQQLDKLHALGYEFCSSWELEVMLVNPDTFKPIFTNATCYYRNDIYEAHEDMLQTIDMTLREMGVELEAIHSEGVPGQFEFVTSPTLGIKQADNLILMKDVIRSVAKKHGHKVVTMAKPFPNRGKFSSNSSHLNQSLKDAQGDNVFWNASEANRLSEVWRHWLGGLLKHSQAICAFTSPTINCYRRLHRFARPSKIDWGIDDRRACYRVKNFDADQSYIESKMPSSAANPYLVMAAHIAAGLDGLARKYDVNEPYGTEGAKHIDLPFTLKEAVDELKNDTFMVDAMGANFVEWYLMAKAQEIETFKDVDIQSNDDSVYEMERKYYDVY